MPLSDNLQDKLINRKQTLGFLGTGTLATALIEGWASLDEDHRPMSRVLITKRSEKNSKRLKKTYGDLIEVSESATAIAEKSDVLFLCVRPEHAPEMLKEIGPILRERDNALLINCISNLSRESAAEQAGISRDVIVRAIPLPSSAWHLGNFNLLFYFYFNRFIL